MGDCLNRWFALEARGTTVAREARGAAATFLTMAYILFANPHILHQGAGIPFGPAVACTALAAGLASLLMGLTANFPVALASGMGLNAIVAYQLAHAPGSTWQIAMGLVILDGLVIFVLVLIGVREALLHAIPEDLRRAIGAGIGLFIAFIGAVQAKIVVVPGGTLAELSKDAQAIVPPVGFGSLRQPETVVALVGLLIMSWLLVRGVKGAILLGIALGTALALALGVARVPTHFEAPSFEIAFQADVLGALQPRLLPLLLPLLLVDFFDTLGTVTALADQSKLADKQGNIPRLKPILLVDSASASVGGLLGASSVTCYIESAAGIAEGARTGLHSVMVGLLFLLAIFAAPLAGIVPGAATAPALILVGFLMCAQLAQIDFTRFETALPAFLTIIVMPFTYSIAHGIGLGFLAYVLIQVLMGRYREVHPLMAITAGLFLAYFIFGV